MINVRLAYLPDFFLNKKNSKELFKYSGWDDQMVRSAEIWYAVNSQTGAEKTKFLSFKTDFWANLGRHPQTMWCYQCDMRWKNSVLHLERMWKKEFQTLSSHFVLKLITSQIRWRCFHIIRNRLFINYLSLQFFPYVNWVMLYFSSSLWFSHFLIWALRIKLNFCCFYSPDKQNAFPIVDFHNPCIHFKN